MIYEIKDTNYLDKIRDLFGDIRFFMGKSVLDGMMGQAYIDNPENPKIAFLTVRSYCFISGNIKKNKLKHIIDENFKEYKLIPSDSLSMIIEEVYKDDIIKSYRYSLKKNPVFDILKLQHMKDCLPKDFKLIKINGHIADKIKKEKFITITDDYEKYGIGVCCVNKNQIVGVASSNIFYNDGIEVNIKVKEEYRRKGIATAMASSLVLECLKIKKKVSWDAANTNSVGLAEKLGFEYDSKYKIYSFK